MKLTLVLIPKNIPYIYELFCKTLKGLMTKTIYIIPSINGYVILSGFHICLVMFLRNFCRAKAEYDYSRALLGCSKNTDPENEAR